MGHVVFVVEGAPSGCWRCKALLKNMRRVFHKTSHGFEAMFKKLPLELMERFHVIQVAF